MITLTNPSTGNSNPFGSTIDYPEIQTVASGTILGRRSSSGNGIIEELTGLQIRTEFKLSEIIFDRYIDIGSSGSAETEIYGYNVLANKLSSDGDKILFDYALKLTALSTTTLRLSFGGSGVFTSSSLIAGAAIGSASLDGWIVKTGASGIRCITRLQTDNGGANIQDAVEIDIPNLALSGNNYFKLTGQGTSDNDVLGKMAYGEWKPAA